MVGAESGLGMLFVSCAAIAAVLFRTGERIVMLAMVALAMAGWLLTSGAHVNGFTLEQYASMQRLHAMSAMGACGIIGIVLSAIPGQNDSDKD